jgi:predicted GTPase
MGKLGEFILKRIEEKKTQRWIITSDDLFTLCGDMGIIEEDDVMIDIMEYLEDNQIDVNFHNNKSAGYYKIWNELERKVKLKKMLIGSKTEVQKLIEKVDSVKVQDRPDWLEAYRNDEDTTPVAFTDKDNNLGKSILDRLTKEVRDRVDNEPGITLEEIQEQINNELNNN